MGELPTVRRTFTVLNKLGLHARPASLFAKTAKQYQSEILVQKDEQQISGKSIIGLLTLAAAQGTTFAVTAQGEDAVEALDALERLVASKFGEE